MKSFFYKMNGLLAVLLYICIFQGCGQESISTSQITQVTISENEIDSSVSSDVSDSNTEALLEETLEVPPEDVFDEYDITLMAIGDNLLHPGIINTGKQEDGSYNYDFLFEPIAEYLDKSDIKIINQETIFGGNDLAFSGYPAFNSPTEVGDAIAAAGFNVVLHSSNHTYDMGFDGLKHCAAFWEKYPEVLTVGIYKDPTPDPEIPILTIEGVTFAILNYTYGPNLEVVPNGLENHMNFLCNLNESSRWLDFTTIHPQVLEDIKEAKELADVVIVCPHWGTEYTTKPSSYQQKWALQMTEAGADLIIGTHPHVIQPIEWIEAENGNRALCYYSLGNYVSTQKDPLCMLEAMAWVTFHITEDSVTISEENTGAIPLVCHYTSGPLRLDAVYPLDNYTEELALSHGIWSWGGVPLHLEELQTWSDEILGEWVLPAK